MARVAGQRNLHLHHHYPRQQLAPTSRFPPNGKGYAIRVRRTTSADQPKKAYYGRGQGMAVPRGSPAINRKSLSLIIWPKRWQAWLTLIFGQDTQAGQRRK